VASAEAAIDKVVDMGIGDRDRIGVAVTAMALS